MENELEIKQDVINLAKEISDLKGKTAVITSQNTVKAFDDFYPKSMNFRQ